MSRPGGIVGGLAPTPVGTAIGFVTGFFDTLGVGSFAPTTALFRCFRTVPDEQIPGTLNVGHTLATIVQAVIFTQAVDVDATTLITMIAASTLGAWLGAGVVSTWPRRRVQLGMGLCLLVASGLTIAQALDLVPGGGQALGVDGVRLGAALAGNFLLGALMTMGIGVYGPCLIIGGIPAVLIAAFIVKALPLAYVRWLVVAVVLYTAVTLLRSSRVVSAVR